MTPVWIVVVGLVAVIVVVSLGGQLQQRARESRPRAHR